MKNNEKAPLISIIIVNYNGEKWIKKCLNSLEKQSYTNYEVIIVDNNSQDNSVKIIEEKYKLENFKLIKNKNNSGFAKGNNIGIKKAKGEFILLLNNDTWVKENFLKEMYYYYRDNDLDVISCLQKDYEEKDIDYAQAFQLDLIGFPTRIENYQNQNKIFFLSGACILFKKELYIHSGGLSEDFFMYFEEIDWFWRLNKMGCKFGVCTKTEYHHAVSVGTGKNILNKKRFLWRNQNQLMTLLRNEPIIILLFIFPLYLIQGIIESIFLLLLGKIQISLSFYKGIIFNIKRYKEIKRYRKKYRNYIKKDNFKIISKKRFLGFGKFKSLYILLKRKINA